MFQPFPSLLAAMSVAAPLAAIAAPPAAAASDPLASHRCKDRVLLVVGPGGGDPQVRRQRAIFQGMGPEASDRDLRLVEVLGDTAQAAALRLRFGLGPGFHALLIGKDGGAKLSGASPLRAAALMPTIDAMPMRREEMRRRP